MAQEIGEISGLLPEMERYGRRRGKRKKGKQMEIVIAIIGAVVLFGALVRSGGWTTSWLAGEDDGEGWQSMFGDDGIWIRSSDDMFNDDDADLLYNDDIYYSPIYSHLPCNIHYDSSSDFLSSDDDFMSSSSAFDDDWPSSSIDDDFCGTSSIGIDDDICGCGCSSFDDDGIGCGCGMWDD